jgi:hypothetical protein
MVWPNGERRSSTGDRRGSPRGGRRDYDLPHTVSCAHCGTQDVRGLGRSWTGLWCLCGRCGFVWKVTPAGLP